MFLEFLRRFFSITSDSDLPEYGRAPCVPILRGLRHIGVKPVNMWAEKAFVRGSFSF